MKTYPPISTSSDSNKAPLINHLDCHSALTRSVLVRLSTALGVLLGMWMSVAYFLRWI